MSYNEIGPQPGPQTSFLSTSADIAIYGGAAGSGKTWGELLEPLRHIDNPDFGAVIFRRTYPEITNEGALWSEAGKIYPVVGGRPKLGDLMYTFPSGMRVSFCHLVRDETVLSYHASQIPLIEFDELTHFSRYQFLYMLSRNRSMCGVRPYVRATCNPDPDSWVAEFISWWIDQDTGYPIEDRSGVIRWFVRAGNDIVWYDTSAAAIAAHGPNTRPKSVTFIAANIYDNPALIAADPDYLGNLQALDYVDMMRLLKGNWKVRAAAGTIFNRNWYNITQDQPRGGTLVRFWDLAATEKKIAGPNTNKGNDPCFTAGVLMRLSKRKFTIEDLIATQKGPAEIDDLLLATSRRDLRYAHQTGATYRVRWEEEGGAAGVRDTANIAFMLRGFDAMGIRPDGDKYARAKPFGSQSRSGNVELLEGLWNQTWLNHMHNQPQKKKDIMDSTSGAYTSLVSERQFTSSSGGQEQLSNKAKISAATPR